MDANPPPAPVITILPPHRLPLTESDSRFVYDVCVMMAKFSPCKKLGFGSVVGYLEGDVFQFSWAGCNRPMEPVAYLCEKECVRLKIPSRTHSMIGACAHGEELGVIEVMKAHGGAYFAAHKVLVFVQGWNPSTEEPIAQRGEHTCIRCATSMYLHGVHAVCVWQDDGWLAIPVATAMRAALAYAVGAKKV